MWWKVGLWVNEHFGKGWWDGFNVLPNSLPRWLKERLQPNLLPHRCTVQPHGVHNSGRRARKGTKVWFWHRSEKESSDLRWGKVHWLQLITGGDLTVLVFSQHLTVFFFPQMKNNPNQICWLLEKVPRSSDPQTGFTTFQQFLDNQQYTNRGILRYEKMFGAGYVSTGGPSTTKVAMWSQKNTIPFVVINAS